ncbi:MAG: hypothetical protein JXQ65_16420 [Candidatus Marinimicrobia bacterium]|nr:hypothetical protein [Candidatus Neomarinimicrobiota bacterium]
MAKKIYRKIKAGNEGTKYLVSKYGDRLISVRYIYDSDKKVKMKTVELIEDLENWNPMAEKIPWNKIMHLKVDYGEADIGRLIRSAGGKWNKDKQFWELRYREGIVLRLESRIINN